jgi:hypothetical protein
VPSLLIAVAAVAALFAIPEGRTIHLAPERQAQIAREVASTTFVDERLCLCAFCRRGDRDGLYFRFQLRWRDRFRFKFR